MIEEQRMPAPDVPEEEPRQEPEEEPKPYKTLTFDSKEKEEEHYNRVFRQRDKRTRGKIREEVAEELRDEIQAEVAEDKANASKAAERRKAKIGELEGRIEELEGELESRDAAVSEISADRDRYVAVIEKQWDGVRDRVPEHVMELIEDRDVLYRMDYVTKHRDKLQIGEDGEEPGEEANTRGEDGEAGAEPFVVGAPSTPPGVNPAQRTGRADSEAREQVRTRVRQAL